MYRFCSTLLLLLLLPVVSAASEIPTLVPGPAVPVSTPEYEPGPDAEVEGVVSSDSLFVRYGRHIGGVYLERFTPEGTPLDPHGFTIAELPPGDSGIPAVVAVSNGESFLFLWSSMDRIYTRIVHPDLTMSEIRLHGAFGTRQIARPMLVWTGAHYLAAVTYEMFSGNSSSRVTGLLLDAEGEALREVILDVGNQFVVDRDLTGGGGQAALLTVVYPFAARGSSELEMIPIDTGGSPQPRRYLPTANVPVRNVTASYVGDETHVFWSGEFGVKALVVDPDGATVVPVRSVSYERSGLVAVVEGPDRSIVEFLAEESNEWRIGWVDGETIAVSPSPAAEPFSHAARLGDRLATEKAIYEVVGTTLEEVSPLPDRTVSRAQGFPDIAIGRNIVLVTWLESTPEGPRLLAVRFDRQSTMKLDANPIVVVPASEQLQQFATTWDGDAFLIAWERGGERAIRFRRLTECGGFPDAGPSSVPVCGNVWIGDIDLARSGGVVLLTWMGADCDSPASFRAGGVRIVNGAVIDGVPFGLSPLFNAPFAHEVGTRAGQFLSVWYWTHVPKPTPRPDPDVCLGFAEVSTAAVVDVRRECLEREDRGEGLALACTDERCVVLAGGTGIYLIDDGELRLRPVFRSERRRETAHPLGSEQALSVSSLVPFREQFVLARTSWNQFELEWFAGKGLLESKFDAVGADPTLAADGTNLWLAYSRIEPGPFHGGSYRVVLQRFTSE